VMLRPSTRQTKQTRLINFTTDRHCWDSNSQQHFLASLWLSQWLQHWIQILSQVICYSYCCGTSGC